MKWMRFEFRSFFYKHKIRWMGGLFIQLFLGFEFLREYFLFNTEPTFEPTFTGLWMYAFEGTPEYFYSQTGKFELPILWMVFQAYLLFLTCDYVVEGLSGYEQQSFVRTKKRSIWASRKMIVECMLVLLYYLQFFVGMLIYFGIRSGTPIWNSIHGPIAIFLLPLMMSEAIVCVQALLSIIFSSNVSYIFSLSLLICSVYKQSFVLIGNYGMLLRTDLIRDDGVSSEGGIVLCLFLLFLSWLILICKVSKIDIKGKELKNQ